MAIQKPLTILDDKLDRSGEIVVVLKKIKTVDSSNFSFIWNFAMKVRQKQEFDEVFTNITIVSSHFK